MLQSIRHYTGRGVSTIGTAALFVVTLPIILAATVIMMFAAMIALVNLKQRSRATGFDSEWKKAADNGPSAKQKKQDAPIEGSYTVIKD